MKINNEKLKIIHKLLNKTIEDRDIPEELSHLRGLSHQELPRMIKDRNKKV